MDNYANKKIDLTSQRESYIGSVGELQFPKW